MCVHSLDRPLKIDFSVRRTTLLKCKFVLKTAQKSHKQNWKNKYYFGICSSATFFSDNANYTVHLMEGTQQGVPTATQNTIRQQ